MSRIILLISLTLLIVPGLAFVHYQKFGQDQPLNLEYLHFYLPANHSFQPLKGMANHLEGSFLIKNNHLKKIKLTLSPTDLELKTPLHQEVIKQLDGNPIEFWAENCECYQPSKDFISGVDLICPVAGILTINKVKKLFSMEIKINKNPEGRLIAKAQAKIDLWPYGLNFPQVFDRPLYRFAYIDFAIKSGIRRDFAFF